MFNGSHQKEIIHNMKGGKGDFHIEHLIDQEKLGKAGNMIARTWLKSGDSVGKHIHEDTIELCYFLAGEGMVIEDGMESVVHGGDVNYVPMGASHEIVNTGQEDLVYIAMVLKP